MENQENQEQNVKYAPENTYKFESRVSDEIKAKLGGENFAFKGINPEVNDPTKIIKAIQALLYVVDKSDAVSTEGQTSPHERDFYESGTRVITQDIVPNI